MGRGQIWSMDLIIGVLVFLIAVGVIVMLVSKNERTDTTSLVLESEVVATKLTSDPAVQVTDGDQLDMAALFALAKEAETDYDGVKTKLGITDEVCIYLTDEEGNLVYITNNDGTTKYPGIGPGTLELNLSDGDLSDPQPTIPCGDPCPAGKCGG